MKISVKGIVGFIHYLILFFIVVLPMDLMGSLAVDGKYHTVVNLGGATSYSWNHTVTSNTDGFCLLLLFSLLVP